MNGKANALRERWTSDVLQQVFAAFERQTVFTPFPPVVVEGETYQDLRGLPIQHPLQNAVLERLDVSAARMDYDGHFENVTASDCLFIGATLDGNMSGVFRRSRFDSAVLEGVTIHPWSTFSECTFAKADLRNAKGTAVTFDRCDFRAANLKSVRLNESEFHLCNWSDTRFGHTMFVKSKITRAGFPMDQTIQDPGRPLPPVTVDDVEWLESPRTESWPEEFERLMEERAAAKQRRNQERLVQQARDAFKAERFREAISRFAEASALGPLDDVSAKMFEIARRRTA
jgi:hypothetical protein